MSLDYQGDTGDTVTIYISLKRPGPGASATQIKAQDLFTKANLLRNMNCRPIERYTNVIAVETLRRRKVIHPQYRLLRLLCFLVTWGSSVIMWSFVTVSYTSYPNCRTYKRLPSGLNAFPRMPTRTVTRRGDSNHFQNGPKTRMRYHWRARTKLARQTKKGSPGAPRMAERTWRLRLS